MRKNFDAAEFKRRMAKLPEKVRKAYQDALKQDAKEMAQLARALAPKGDTGDLKRSIEIKDTATGGVVVEANEFYARFVEFGTQASTKGERVSASGDSDQLGRRRSRKSRRTHSGTDPNPFFWIAYRTLKRRFYARRRRAVTKALKEI